jgi:hypothetical protein
MDVKDALNGAERDAEGCWHRVATLGLSTQSNLVPEFRFLLDVSLKKRGDKFAVKSPPDGREFELKTLEDEQAKAFKEHVFTLIKEWLDRDSDISSAETGAKPRTIGFLPK